VSITAAVEVRGNKSLRAKELSVPKNQVPQYLRLPAAPDSELRLVYQSGKVENVQDYLNKQLPGFQGRFTVSNLPSLDWELVVPDVDTKPPPVDHLVIPIRVDEDVLYELRRAIVDREGESAIGADLAAGTGEYWCPRSVDQRLFGSRVSARELIHADVLCENNLFGAADNRPAVNVVVVDHGLDKQFVPNFKGGWKHTNPYNNADVHLPGMTVGEDSEHGRMMVRNIRNTAPKVNIWDMPLIPPRIWDIDVFISDAQAAFDYMLSDIRNYLIRFPRWSGPWVLVNAWAIFDRRSEHPSGDYTNRLSHPFNAEITTAVLEGRDVIFCAGNCGQFCPDGRCGPWDIGPGQSVLGANSHPRVISVGAVRTDAIWLGYSSQGPGQPKMARLKPDFCAPSSFSETADAYTSNTGTSAACGVTAGVVAALRSRPGWEPGTVSPNELRRTLNRTTRRTQGRHWNERLGHGILDVQSAFEDLTIQFP
jgi:Subtilase family